MNFIEELKSELKLYEYLELNSYKIRLTPEEVGFLLSEIAKIRCTLSSLGESPNSQL